MARFSWATLGLVILGGAIGAGARAAIVLPLPPSAHPLVVPSVTLLVNVAGSFLLGLLVASLDGRRPGLRAFAGTGVLGGFTTYSAFALQTVDTFGAAPVVGLALAAVSVVVGFVAAAVGLALGGRRGALTAARPEEAE